MVKKVITVLCAVLLCCAVSSCSQSSSGADSDPYGAQAAKGAKPPASSPLAKIKLGMNDTQVRNILGSPTDTNAYATGKAWIPFFWGSDTSRTDWMYRGKGRVVFSRNRYSGGLKVIRIDYNPKELGG